MPITIFGTIIILASAITSLIFWRLLPRIFRWVSVQCILAAIVEIAGAVFKEFSQSNVWIYNIYMVLEPLTIGYAAYLIIKGYKYFISITIAILSCYWLYLVSEYGLSTFANKVLLFQNILYALLSLLILKKMSRRTTPFSQIPEIWLAMAFLVFSSGSIPIMGLFNNLQNVTEKGVAEKMYYITQLLCIHRYVFVTVAFILIAKQKRNLSSLPAYERS